MRKLKKKYKKYLTYAISATLAVALIVGMGLIYSYSKNHEIREFEPLNIDDLPKHNYLFDFLKEDENGYLTYSDLNGVNATLGIDVSSHQGDIDWVKVKNSGIDFAYIRLGYRGYQSGLLNLDTHYYQNMQGAIDAGLKVGVYFFSQAINDEEALAEANFVLSHIKDFTLDYPIVYDLEEITYDDYRSSHIDSQTKTNNALVFCGRILAANQKPMIYTNLSWATNHFFLEEILNFDIWFAQYAPRPDFIYQFDIWQYTDSGKVDGVNTPVDINLDFSGKY